MTLLAVALVVLVFMPVVLIAKLPKRATPWIALVWIAFPIPAYWILIAAENIGRPEDPAHSMDNAWAGFYLLSAVLAVPWLIFWAGGVAIGIALRRGRLQRPTAQAAAASEAEAVTKPDVR